MFEIDAPIDDKPSRTRRAGASGRARYITRQAEEMAAAGVIDVDPKLFGWSMWAAIHGIVMLHQAGMLEHGPDYKTLAYFHGAADAARRRRHDRTRSKAKGKKR